MDVEKSYSLFCQAIANGDMEEAELYYDGWIN